MAGLLDQRFDEFAAEGQLNLGPRAAAAVGAGLISSLVLPWRLTLAWTALNLALEAWGWFAGRRQRLGLPVGLETRVSYLAYMCCLIAVWFAIGLLLWTTGSLAGAVSATIVWISMIGFGQTFGSRTPLGFGICGVVPALGVLAVAATDPRLAGADVWLTPSVMAIGLGFAIFGARQTLAAARRHERTRLALERSEAEHRLLADTSSDVIARIGLDFVCRYVSPSIRQQLGYNPQGFIDLAPEAYIHANDLNGYRAAFAEVAAGRGSATTQHRRLHRSGAVIWVETTFSLARDPETGEPLEVICISRDISARKALERDLVEARERAEAASAAKADFLANMTHELRTPLNAIIGFSRVLKESAELSDRDARHAGLISEASATLLVVVNDVLDFSKLESGALELDPRPFDPVAMARSVAMLMERQAEARGLTLEVRADDGAATLLGDGERMRQVVLNLISNALKFTTAGGVTVTVELGPAAGSEARPLRISVTDTGIGIAPDKLEAVFDRFSQADVSVSRRYGGTGLGLAICKRIVELMGGRIGVASRPGQGSTFWFEVMLPPAPDASLAAPAEPPQAALERPIRLLLAEDIEVNRELVRVMLEPFDINIETAQDGAEAVAAVARADYDLVLMDVQMPVMDGLTATRRIRAQEAPGASRLPIIAMTANVLPDQVRRCLEAGMDDHIGKPIDPAALLGAIARWTGGGDEAAEDAAPRAEAATRS